MKRLSEYDAAVSRLNEANDAYYKDSDPIMSDAKYDELYDEVVEYEAKHPDHVNPNSPTGFVGSDSSSGFKKEAHKFPMLSIGKITKNEELQKFILDISKAIAYPSPHFNCELKIDGCSLSLIYEDGKLVKAITRGDGKSGDLVTDNAMTIKSIPKSISRKGRVEIRGECVIFKDNFEVLNADLKRRKEKTYENPRNLVSGSMKLKDPAETAKRMINFIAYSIVDGGSDVHSEDMDLLENWDFEISPRELASDIKHINRFIEDIDKTKSKLKYEIDGVVIKLDDKTKYAKCGGTSKYHHWLKAFKFQPEVAIAILESVDFPVGRTGVITPRGWFKDGVRLAGTTVEKATLHNFDEIERLGIAIGDEVYLKKGGEIIPKITGLHKKALDRKLIKIPSECPVCKGKVGKDDEENVSVKCLNDECESKFYFKFIKWCSKSAMDMRGISSQTLIQICDHGLMKWIDELYTLTENDLLKLERFGETKAKNTISAIQGSKKAGLTRVLIGLGIPGCGDGTCKDLANYFGNIDAIMKAEEEDFLKVGGIKERATDIYYYFQDTRVQILIGCLKKHGVVMTEEKKQNMETSSNKLNGSSFVCTGKMENPREEMHSIIEANGGVVQKAVTKGTTYLICGENVGSVKTDKAEKVGCKVIDEDQFWEMIK